MYLTQFEEIHHTCLLWFASVRALSGEPDQGREPVGRMHKLAVGKHEKERSDEAEMHRQQNSHGRSSPQHHEQQATQAGKEKLGREGDIHSHQALNHWSLIALQLKPEQSGRTDHQAYATESSGNNGNAQECVRRRPMQDMIINGSNRRRNHTEQKPIEHGLVNILDRAAPQPVLVRQVRKAATAGTIRRVALRAVVQEQLAAVSAERDTIFKGETLRAILLNAYGWWTVGQITLYAGIGMVIDQERIEELPLVDRDLTRLIMFTGAAVEGRGTRTNYPGTAFPALAGGSTGSVAFAPVPMLNPGKARSNEISSTFWVASRPQPP